LSSLQRWKSRIRSLQVIPRTIVINQPVISIGLPVYNGEQFIRQTLDSLLAQDCGNFELIISDNASIDGTAAICQEYQARDQRIRYCRNETNVGATRNFNRVFELSRGDFFMWAGAHDLWHPSFVSRCLSVLNEDKSVVLAYSQTMLVNIEGEPTEIAPDKIDTRGMSPLERYRHLIWNLKWCNLIHGLIRSKALNNTNMFRDFFGPDHLLLAELSLEGAFAQIQEPLFYRRLNRPDEGNDVEAWKKRALETLNPENSSKRSEMSLTDLFRELRNAHLRVLWKSRLGTRAKIKGMMETIRCYDSNFAVTAPGDRVIRKLTRNRISNYLTRRSLPPGTRRHTNS
jgi:glycosyltransferase involved in cell wall biosynthesis